MKAIKLYEWLDELMKKEAFPEDADLVLSLNGIGGGYIYLENPTIDEEGDIVFTEGEV
nr:MAG TPA: hypothetical protein [Caudoviricetes sp.]